MDCKACFKCGIVKPLDEFYRHSAMSDGRLGKCKECTKNDVSENYYKRRKQYATYEKARFQSQRRKEWLKVYGPIAKARNAHKVKARCAVANALQDGKICRKPCEVCGSLVVQAHHDDYSKPLDVRWLCLAHHLEAHGKSEVT